MLSTMDKLIQMGKELGYEMQALQEFVKQQQAFEKQQQDIERSERLAERELEKERIAAEKDKIAQVEKDREVELARIAAEKEKIAADREIEMARKESIERQAEKDREAKLAQIEGDKEAKLATEIELEKLKYSFARQHDELKGQMNLQRAVFKVELQKQKAEKLPYFDEIKDKMDSYLSRFEKYATANEWKKSVWAAYLSALLKGRELDVYDRLSVDDAADYEKLKEALLKNFDMTERGFRKKFRYERPEKPETFIQFSSRLRSYLNKWLKMAKIEESYEAVCELYVHLKPKSFKNLEEMAKEADLFAEARGGEYTCVNKAQRDNIGGSQHKPDSKPSGKPEIKCSICGKGHLTSKCYKNPDRKQAYSAEVGIGANGYGGSKGSNSVPKEEAQGMQSKNDNMPSEGKSSSRGRGNFRGRGRGNDNRNHQLRFCKSEINRKSDEIKGIYQSKSESPLIADKEDEEVVCYFLRSRLLTAQGTVNGKKVNGKKGF